MNVNKKFDRLRQWGKEKMGAEIKSGTTEDFKALEAEMNLRQDGLEKMHASMGAYVKSLNRRVEGEAKEKSTPVASLGSAMARHGEDFENCSQFGQCLLTFGMANERIARMQESYAAQATSSWLQALERSLAQMRDYQNARKKLDSRRLAYDATLAKVQKAKKEDYRAEEGLRSQKAKFDESTEDVQRRMQDIVESEQDNMTDLSAFLDAELSYHDRCREVLLRLKKDWPAGYGSTQISELYAIIDASASSDTSTPSNGGRAPRSRENTVSRITSNQSTVFQPEDEQGPQSLRRPTPPFRNASCGSSANSSPHREPNPPPNRIATSDPYPSRTQTPLSGMASHDLHQFRTTHAPQNLNAFGDDDAATNSSPERHSFWEGSSTTRSSSPATTASYATGGEASSSRSRNGSWSMMDPARSGAFASNNISTGVVPGAAVGSVTGLAKKAPPPPPPSRGTKSRPAPPPPPPMKRSALSTSAVPSAV